MHCRSVSFLIFSVVAVQLSTSARILGIGSIPSYSHQIAYQPLWRELSLRGHQLTVLTPNPINDPSLINLTEIDLGFSYELWNANVLELFKFTEDILGSLNKLISVVSTMQDEQLQHLPVQALIKNDTEHFDLLILEAAGPMLAFAERFKCPAIGIVSLEPPSIVYEMMGNPTHPVVNPDANLPFVGELTFFERLISTFYELIFNAFAQFTLPAHQRIVDKHFGKGYSQVDAMMKNLSMLFVNTDTVFHQIRPLVPAVVQIGGGFHRRSSQPLPEHLQKLLDDAPQGFVYFSLGSNVKGTDLPESARNIILDVFSELPYLVLWKFELPDLSNKPKNVVISKWFPQQDILRHPNIKVFITQGGQQSLEEAIYSHVPIIGMPFFGDQLGNIKRFVHKGLGLSIDPVNLDKESFKNVLLEVINNPKYRNRVKELADLAQDQPMTGLEKAVWWTEYVLRHKGARHLRSPVLDIPLYQYYLLDVIGFCLLVLFLTFYLLNVVIKGICRLLKNFVFTRKEKVE